MRRDEEFRLQYFLLALVNIKSERAREGEGKKKLVVELIRNSWMRICNRDQTRRNKTRRVTHNVDSQPHAEDIRDILTA